MAGAEIEGSGAEGVDWRRNTAALALSQFTVVFGFTFILPFIPVYLHNDLGVHNPSQLALWSGVVTGSTGFVLAVANPLWGLVADRYGRKPMVVRAMFGGAFAMALAAVVQLPIQLLGVRILVGLVGGTVPAATALVVAETPPAKVGRALGAMGAAMSLGRTLGPLVGGVLAAIFTLRHVFLAAAAIVIATTFIVIFFAHETPRPVNRDRRSFAELRHIPRASRRAIGALMAAQGLTQLTFGANQQMLVLRLLAFDPRHVQIDAGVAFAAGGLAAVVAAAIYWRAADRLGYRLFLIAACVLLGTTSLGLAEAPNVVSAIAVGALANLIYGGIGPALSTVLGQEAPAGLKGTIFGLNSSAMSLGTSIGLVGSGLITAAAGIGGALVVAAMVATAASGSMYLWGREPVEAGS